VTVGDAVDEFDTFSSDVADPQPTPPRPAGSIRRTSHIDMSFPAGGGLHLTGTCRDLVTGADTRVLAQATVDATLDADFVLTALETTGGGIAASVLVDSLVRAGFRARVDQAMSTEMQGAPLFVLLDDLPVATLISGYARLYDGDLDRHQADARAHMTDVCSGWRADGLMIRSIGTTGRMPIPIGPDAPPPETEDPLAWHHLPLLPTGSMRRRRLIDVSPGTVEGFDVLATFRDTFVGADGVQRVLHEYTLVALVDVEGRITECVATPRVLPWNECPHAAASASRLVGQHASDIRRAMRGVRGVGTCTHLNDLLRSLGDLDVLIAKLRPTDR
jgi:Protein of unknown function (DUF2889)